MGCELRTHVEEEEANVPASNSEFCGSNLARGIDLGVSRSQRLEK